MTKFSRLLLATNNKGKVEEIRALLAWLPVELVTPEDIGLILEVPEDGKTYAQNAGKKALAFARLPVGLPPSPMTQAWRSTH